MENADGKPKFQPIMMVIDEMVESPAKAKGNYFRCNNKSNHKAKVLFLVPKDFDEAKFPALLERVANEIKTEPGDYCTLNVESFFCLVYGHKKKFKTQGKNKQKRC